MIRTDERQGEGAGLNPADIHRDKSEAGTSYGVQHLRTKRIADRSNQIRRRQLDPRNVVVVSNSQLRESQLPQRGLGAVDLAELGRRDHMVVRNPRREARRSRLVGHLQTQSAGHRTHCQLGHASVGERPEDVVVGGGTRTWSVRSPGIVGVLSVRNGIQPVLFGDPIIDPAEEFFLAVETPIRPVGPILRTITFVRRHLDEPYADLARDPVGSTPLLGSKARGHPEQGDNSVGAKDLRRERKQQGRIDAAGERNAQPTYSCEAGRDGRLRRVPPSSLHAY